MVNYNELKYYNSIDDNISFSPYEGNIKKMVDEFIDTYLNEDEDEFEVEDKEMPIRQEYSEIKKLESKLHQALLCYDKKSFNKIISTMVKKYNKVIYESEYAYTVNEFTPFINMAKLLPNNLEKLRCFEAIENNISSYQKSELEKQYFSLEKDIEVIRNEERKKYKKPKQKENK